MGNQASPWPLSSDPKQQLLKALKGKVSQSTMVRTLETLEYRGSRILEQLKVTTWPEFWDLRPPKQRKVPVVGFLNFLKS